LGLIKSMLSLSLVKAIGSEREGPAGSLVSNRVTAVWQPRILKVNVMVNHGAMRMLILCLMWLFISPAAAAHAGTPFNASPNAPPNAPIDHVIADMTGRRVTVPVDPQRVVALAPSVTEIVYDLGQEWRLVGVTQFSDYPPAAGKLPKVGSYVHLDVERIMALRPDVCIGIKDGNPLVAVEQLEALNIPIFAVDPHNIDSVIQSVAVIGRLLSAQDRADRVVSDMRARIRRIRTRTAAIHHKPSVFFQIGVSPIVSVGSDTFTSELITLAGGINAAAGPAPYPRFSVEQVIALAPDVIVISSMERAAVFEQVKADWEKWPAIPAVRRGAVFIAPTNLFDRPTPRLVEALEFLAGLIHPELFKENP
jgi:cobalamin transport system substrate-binding protein